MNAVSIPRHGESDGSGRDNPTRLASLIAARLCHDLISPLGAIGNGVELLEMSGEYPGISKSPELSLIDESVRAARARVRFYRIAFGHAAADQRVSVAEIGQLLEEHVSGGRLTVELDGSGDLARLDARLLLLSLMCLESALPWGGRVLICRGADGWRLVAEASRTRIEPQLWQLLSGGGIAALVAPADVHFTLLAALAGQAGRRIGWEMDETGGEISL